MKVAICAIAKHENDYINDWCNYHLSKDFDDIYIYDNNDSSTEYVGNLITNKSNVHIIPHNDRFAEQVKTYQCFYDTIGKNYDWIAYIDIDEYIECENIKKILDNQIYNNFNEISIKLINMDDNGLLYNNGRPVYERFKNISKFQWHSIKSIVKANKNIQTDSPHYFKTNACYINGEPIRTDIIKSRYRYGDTYKHDDLQDYDNICYIKHYDCKTISEYIKFKFNRTDAMYGNLKTLPKPIPERSFFKHSKKTIDKLKILYNTAQFNGYLDLIVKINTTDDLTFFKTKLNELFEKYRHIHIFSSLTDIYFENIDKKWYTIYNEELNPNTIFNMNNLSEFYVILNINNMLIDIPYMRKSLNDINILKSK